MLKERVDDFSKFIAVYFPHIHKDCLSKDNDLKCEYCGKIIFKDGYLYKDCCKEMQEKLQIQEDDRLDQIKMAEKRKEHDKITFYHESLSASGFEGFEVGVKFSTYKASSPLQDRVKSICKSFVESDDHVNLILAGSVGVGKTHLACATAKAIGFYQKKSFGIVRCSMLDIKNKPDYFDFDVLIFDDIGREAGSENRIKITVGILSGIIEYRHRNKMKSIFTTNLKIEELNDKYGSHIVDRIIDKCMIAPRINMESKRGDIK